MRCPRCNSRSVSRESDGTVEFKCGTWVRDGEVNQTNRCINMAMAGRDTRGEADSGPFLGEDDGDPLL
jgi:hypothetical protein